MPARLKHRDQDDRFTAPLRPRRELFEALWNFALFKTKQRRRRAGLPLAPISRVNVWCQLRQAALIGCYERHTMHLDGAFGDMSPRTLRRHMAAFVALGLVKVVQEHYHDRKRGRWVMRPNIYAITRDGQLWIKKHVGSTKFPSVV